ncbi:MAG TPA: hypothetical protein VMB78_05255 [Dissulfurispiraceae bacterium]|nr:hypothetical protein [Dissulfurispiraceae bacterium]
MKTVIFTILAIMLLVGGSLACDGKSSSPCSKQHDPACTQYLMCSYDIRNADGSPMCWFVPKSVDTTQECVSWCDDNGVMQTICGSKYLTKQGCGE